MNHFSPIIAKLLLHAKSNKYLFICWYLLYRKNAGLQINWFNNDTRLYFDGYPRSGNTFAQMLLKKVYQDLDFVHHFHSIGSLEIAIRKKIPSFILFRDPEDAITSYYLKEHSLRNESDTWEIENFDNCLLRNLLKYYIHYYRNILKLNKKLTLISFDQLIQNPELIMIAVNQVVPDNLKKEEFEIIETVFKEKNAEFGATNKLGSSRPNLIKDRYKTHLKKKLSEFKELEKARSLFNQMKTLS